MNLFSRRQMLQQGACGFGYLALADMLSKVSAADTAKKPVDDSSDSAESRHYQSPLIAKAPHFPAKAKRVIFLFMQGAP